MKISELALFGVSEDFLQQIGTECDRVQSIISYDPLPISEELEYMLGIPPIPSSVTDLQLHKFYNAARNQLYQYKLYLLTGQELEDYQSKIMDLYNNKPKQSGERVLRILLGSEKFNLDCIMSYGFRHMEAFIHTTIPNIAFKNEELF